MFTTCSVTTITHYSAWNVYTALLLMLPAHTGILLLQTGHITKNSNSYSAQLLHSHVDVVIPSTVL
jgi:hypothetical protein